MTEITAAPRHAIFVLGMHRSGTSALSGTLHRLGCAVPNTLMPPAEENSRGFYESAAICAFNDQLLESGGSHWADWTPFNRSWMCSPVAANFKARAQALVASEFGDAPLFVFKDPRNCRLAPFWLEVLELCGVTVSFVHIHRNPLEVAASLEARGDVSWAYGLLLWLRHVLDAEVASRGKPRYFTTYRDLMNNWAEHVAPMQQALGIGFPRISTVASKEVQSFLSDHLRHFAESAANVPRNPLLSPWLRRVFEIFESWAKEGENGTHWTELDDIREQFDAVTPLFGQVVHEGWLAARRLTEVQAREREQVAERDGLLQSQSTLSAQAQRQQQQMQEIQVRLGTTTADVMLLRAQRDGLQAEVRRLLGDDEAPAVTMEGEMEYATPADEDIFAKSLEAILGDVDP